MQFYIETPRLILRDILPEDKLGIFELDSDPEVQKYVGNKPITTMEEANENINFIRQQYTENGIGRWAVIEKESRLFIGWAGLKFITTEMNGHQNFYELGYRFIPKYWGKGFATEAAGASLAYGYQQLGLKTIYAITDINNTASKHVLEKIGFKFITVFSYHNQDHNWLKIEKN